MENIEHTDDFPCDMCIYKLYYTLSESYLIRKILTLNEDDDVDDESVLSILSDIRVLGMTLNCIHTE